MADRTLREPARGIPIVAETDVVVAGGGLTGVMTAVAAARTGASATLLEQYGWLGGVATMHLPLQGYYDAAGIQIVRGLGQELVERLRAIGGAGDFITCELHNPFIIVDQEAVKMVCQQMIEEAGVTLYLHNLVAGAHADGGRLEALVVENKSGRQAIAGRLFVDATGDGDVAARAGAQFTVGRPGDELTQSVTITVRLDNVDTEKMRSRLLELPERYDLYVMPHAQFRDHPRHIVVGLKNLVDRAAADGFQGLPCPRVIYITGLTDGSAFLNMVHVHGVRCHDERDLTRGEMEGRRQVPIVVDFMRRYVPGFEQATLTATSSFLGVRETRHITGDYVLTGDDVVAGRRFADTIATGGYPIDIHSPTGGEVTLVRVPAYGIPYRCLTPKGLDNLLVAGRSISADHTALASARVMATCMAMGQAAGTAAALAARDGASTRQVAVGRLRETLREQGAYLVE
jgi:hypothetical protein